MMPPFLGLADFKALSCDQDPINQVIIELGSPGPTWRAPLRTRQSGRRSLAPHTVHHHQFLGGVWSVIFRDSSLTGELEVRQRGASVITFQASYETQDLSGLGLHTCHPVDRCD